MERSIADNQGRKGFNCLKIYDLQYPFDIDAVKVRREALSGSAYYNTISGVNSSYLSVFFQIMGNLEIRDRRSPVV
jgi:hypothetical protein